MQKLIQKRCFSQGKRRRCFHPHLAFREPCLHRDICWCGEQNSVCAGVWDSGSCRELPACTLLQAWLSMVRAARLCAAREGRLWQEVSGSLILNLGSWVLLQMSSHWWGRRSPPAADKAFCEWSANDTGICCAGHGALSCVLEKHTNFSQSPRRTKAWRSWGTCTPCRLWTPSTLMSCMQPSLGIPVGTWDTSYLADELLPKGLGMLCDQLSTAVQSGRGHSFQPHWVLLGTNAEPSPSLAEFPCNSKRGDWYFGLQWGRWCWTVLMEDVWGPQSVWAAN